MSGTEIKQEEFLVVNSQVTDDGDGQVISPSNPEVVTIPVPPARPLRTRGPVHHEKEINKIDLEDNTDQENNTDLENNTGLENVDEAEEKEEEKGKDKGTESERIGSKELEETVLEETVREEIFAKSLLPDSSARKSSVAVPVYQVEDLFPEVTEENNMSADFQPVVRFSDVKKVYPTPHGDVYALSGVTFDVYPGDFIFLVGASGSGKSTILRLLIKEENVTGGHISVANTNLGTMKKKNIPKLRQQVGTVFQDFRLLSDRTIYDNVAFGLKVLGRPSKEIHSTVTEVLHLVGLGDKTNRYPNELSGGEQQRAAIARAFASNPALLIADEPTGNLDPDTADGIIALLHSINLTGTTVIMATHDSRIVDALAKHVIRLEAGKIVSDETHGDYAGVTATLF